MIIINKVNNVQCKTEIASYGTMPKKADAFTEVVSPNTVVTFVGLFYPLNYPTPLAILQHNDINYLVNPLGLIKLFKVSCFEELEDVYKHTKVLYKGFDTKDFVDKKGIHQTIKILKFDKIQ